jgi:hypothetical protein
MTNDLYLRDNSYFFECGDVSLLKITGFSRNLWEAGCFPFKTANLPTVPELTGKMAMFLP